MDRCTTEKLAARAQSGDPEAYDRWHIRQMGEAVERMVSSVRYDLPGRA